MDIRNENGEDILHMEAPEQELANKYITDQMIVLELGARYGSVSCVINSKLKYKTNQVVVEPDSRVWESLERNKKVNQCEFHIVKGFISNKKLDLINIDSWYGYGTTSIENENTTIPSFSLNEIEKKYNLKFDSLVADCEGFLETFFDENPHMYDQLRFIMYERDYPDKCNYEKINRTLVEKGFNCIVSGHQNIWSKMFQDGIEPPTAGI